MILTKNQISELDSLKKSILFTESVIDKAKTNLEIAIDCNDKEKIKSTERAIKFGSNKINKQVTIQALSMNLEYNLVLDLIFDRENTLEFLKNN